MGNKLKKAFSHKEPEGHKGQLHFVNSDANKVFLKQLEEMFDSGEPFEIKGIDAIETTQIIDGKEYPVSHHTDVRGAKFFPTQEPVNFTVNTAQGEFTWQFSRVRLRDKIVLRNPEKSIIAVTITVYLSNDSINISLKSNPQYADSINSIIFHNRAAIGLLEYLFTKRPIALNELVAQLHNELAFWERTHALEEIMKVSFAPEKINFETINDAMQDIELIYMLLVKNEIVRENRGLDTVESEGSKVVEDADLEELRGEGAFVFFADNVSSIWGVELRFFSIRAALNHVIDSIQRDECSGTVVISFSERASNPRFISTRAFVSQDERSKESERLSEDFSENIKAYEMAKTLNELYEEQP